MKTLRFLLTALAVFCLLPVWEAQAGAQVINDWYRVPLDMILYNECTGEDVHLTGTVLTTNHVVLNDAGIEHWNFTDNWQGVSGVGLTSGITYRASGGNKGSGSTIVGEDIPYHYAAGGIEMIKLVAQGKAPNLFFKYHVRVTVTPDFKFTVEIFDTTLVCK